MSDRFYVNCPLSAPSRLELTGPEAHHLATVCRLRPGDQVCLFNGDGQEYLARVGTVARRSVQLEVLKADSPARELPIRIQVAAPVPKGDRSQFLLEKLTELGVASFVPLRTQRSVVHPGEHKLEKLQRYVIEASKQCGRNVLLHVEQPADWQTYCRRENLPTPRLLAHPNPLPSHPVLQQTAASYLPSPPVPRGRGVGGEGVALAIGPEGGFSNEEVELAGESGWHIVDLGPRILRAETAAIVLATLVSTAPPG